MKTKNLRVYYYDGSYDDESHISFRIEISKDNTKKDFLKKLKKTYLKDEFLRYSFSGADLLEFIDKLEDEEKGDVLYQNVIKNIEFVKEMEDKAYDIQMEKEFDWAVYKIESRFSDDWEEFSLFEEKNILKYLCDNEEFKDWFKQTLLYKNDILCVALFNDYRKNVIQLKKEAIDNYSKNIKYYEETIIDMNEKIKKLQEEIKLLEESK